MKLNWALGQQTRGKKRVLKGAGSLGKLDTHKNQRFVGVMACGEKGSEGDGGGARRKEWTSAVGCKKEIAGENSGGP